MRIIFFLLLSMTIGFCQIKDLGVFGVTYPILEKNILQVLYEKMKSPLGKKLLQEFENTLQSLAKDPSYKPKGALHLTPTPCHKSYLFDPSLSLSHDLFDPNGQRFYQSGDPLNPLDHIHLSKDYIFIDGTQEAQVKWAKNQQSQRQAFIILVKGEPFGVMKEHDLHVFFDQEGAMVQRFHLNHVPCIMTQEGNQLRITEFTQEEITP